MIKAGGYIHYNGFVTCFFVFCFHLSGSKSRYLLCGVRGGIAAALFMISDIYLKKLTPCSLHEHASEYPFKIAQNAKQCLKKRSIAVHISAILTLSYMESFQQYSSLNQRR